MNLLCDMERDLQMLLGCTNLSRCVISRVHAVPAAGDCTPEQVVLGTYVVGCQRGW